MWLPRAARSGRWAVRYSDPRPAQLRALRAAFGPAFALAHPSHRAQQARLAQPMPEDPGPIFERPCRCGRWCPVVAGDANTHKKAARPHKRSGRAR